MSDIAIQVDHVWKKFRKGEMHDSLRELIPAVTRRLFGRSPKNQDLNAREFWALKDVSFEVKRGESLGIIGPNGAGKSTMLKLLSRIIRPNQGEYKVNGRLSALIEVGAGFHQDLTGRENIYLSGTILGMSKKEIQAKEEQIIDFAGVEAFIETPVKRYSSGMMARLGFAVAAHMEPDVLLVDEVLSVGDARFRAKCLSHMKKLIDSNVTVVFISHILEQVRQMCPHSIVLNAGAVAYSGPTPGAIQMYLDLLSDKSESTSTSDLDAELRNIRFCNADGIETIQWNHKEPAVIECDLVIHRPLLKTNVLINFSTVSGVYIGTSNAYRSGLDVPTDPGTYRLRFKFNELPFSDGEYSMQFNVTDIDQNKKCIWASTQPRTIVVGGTNQGGMIVPCIGDWDVIEPQASEAVSPVSAST